MTGNCRDCKYHSDTTGEFHESFDGYPAKIIWPGKEGDCIYHGWNLLNLKICEHFERR